MATLEVMVDTENDENGLQVKVDGEVLENVSSLHVSKSYDDDYYFSVTLVDDKQKGKASKYTSLSAALKASKEAVLSQMSDEDVLGFLKNRRKSKSL